MFKVLISKKKKEQHIFGFKVYFNNSDYIPDF